LHPLKNRGDDFFKIRHCIAGRPFIAAVKETLHTLHPFKRRGDHFQISKFATLFFSANIKANTKILMFKGLILAVYYYKTTRTPIEKSRLGTDIDAPKILLSGNESTELFRVYTKKPPYLSSIFCLLMCDRKHSRSFFVKRA